ncbi:peroxynitrite isomerase THAP4-like [Rhipicephalus sanguineus]|uniref:peroxynitrite isomerase THAP4-like n=1 Tax=Rhipicephalus sanguineus TaxID=34632 RepID=UPI0020C25220|nr:peroxynitrite isomerase THAP4-like [Rhipicephalus sanguineus]
MRCCCVPFCTSSQRKKEAGVSFHEIPANTELRERWLRVIARKNWVPNSTSNYSAVCSLHFVEADFRENTKRRMLKPDAVPSVFPHYPSYMKNEPPKERSCSSIQKRKRDSSTDTLASLPSQKIDSRPASAPEVRADTPKEVTEPSGWQQPESVSSSDIQDLPFVTAASDYCQSANILEPPDAQPAEEGAGARALRSLGVQADSRSTASAFLERKKWREKERAWKQRNERLQATVDAYKKELQQLKEERNVSKLLQVARDSDQGSTKARVIMDQVLNYKAKKPKWCETIIRQGIILRNLST